MNASLKQISKLPFETIYRTNYGLMNKHGNYIES